MRVRQNNRQACAYCPRPLRTGVFLCGRIWNLIRWRLRKRNHSRPTNSRSPNKHAMFCAPNRFGIARFGRSGLYRVLIPLSYFRISFGIGAQYFNDSNIPERKQATAIAFGIPLRSWLPDRLPPLRFHPPFQAFPTVMFSERRPPRERMRKAQGTSLSDLLL
jgi:hypothetical protein